MVLHVLIPQTDKTSYQHCSTRSFMQAGKNKRRRSSIWGNWLLSCKLNEMDLLSLPLFIRRNNFCESFDRLSTIISLHNKLISIILINIFWYICDASKYTVSLSSGDTVYLFRFESGYEVTVWVSSSNFLPQNWLPSSCFLSMLNYYTIDFSK